MTPIGGHESRIANTMTWLTPLYIVESLGNFDLDPCAHPGWVTADRLICLDHGEDGLAEEWRGRVWLNPPYGAEVWQWLDLLAKHGDGIALVFARTETKGFIEQIWEKADAVKFLYGRIHFHRADGSRAPANSGAPSCLVAYGRRNVTALELCDLPGITVHLKAGEEETSMIYTQEQHAYMTGAQCRECKGVTGHRKTCSAEETMTTHDLRTDFSPSEAVIGKAKSYIKNKRVKPDPVVKSIWWVRGSAAHPYRVQSDARVKENGKAAASWVSCTCQYGMNVGGGASACSHAVAVLLLTREQAKEQK